jgi:hypothetical protein
MSNRDNQSMDEESPAFIEFTNEDGGEFHFGYVHGEMDWRPEQRQSRPGAAVTIEGNGGWPVCPNGQPSSVVWGACRAG